ncbi:UDP-N-acetylmuramate--L-alanine ligase [Candidatus Poriferisodalis sp.]|uniref:UDP-N-acetylmuramate--L-alanine ligase n=1 Tax=Candidatus Poriferisodalis sp. TaxID=3101277 RepID=UPI003B023D43
MTTSPSIEPALLIEEMSSRLPDLGEPRSIHLVGAGGAGMNAIGLVLAEMGHAVSGSDLRAGLGMTRLAAHGARVVIGHEAANIGAADIVAHSSAVPQANVELIEARRRGIPVLSRAELLAGICRRKQTLAVGGTHGKTTTSSMLALCLVAAGEHPSFLVGGEVNEIGSGAVWDTAGEWFVVEADESDGTFLELGADAVVVTNVEPDHLDHYGSFDELAAAFEEFVTSAGGPRIVCADDLRAAAMAERVGGCVTYGNAPGAKYRIIDARSSRTGARFELVAGATSIGRCELPLPGLHNVTNAAGALAAALELGAAASPMIDALGRFAGVARRFERRGERDGVSFIDDYAHLPTEVTAAIAAARSGGWKRIVAVFQPHRYSRTAALWQDFADSFADADQVVLTDIYAAGEVPRPGVSTELVLGAVLDAHPYASVAYLPGRTELRSYLRRSLRSGDLCLTLGAGDLTTLADEMLHVS